jgi:hypothetical protein
MAKPFFQVAAESEAEFDKKEIATVFYSICSFMTQQSATKEKTESDYEDLIQQIQSTMKIVDQASDNEANYDKICFYYVSILLLNDQANYMASTGVDQGTVTDLMNELYNKAVNITSSLSYVQELQTSIQKNYDTYLTNIEAQYNQVAKKAQMGGQGNG